ncbi:hypothetical protein CDV31_016541 [Fusarium ambrosium]|uniref:Uncharacterized protein n=1 Tax=Fusarium ambrosium TaxID=131363 RepID=A0A428S6Y3_9HYPO|nr:hypothetical protein CDV31_016541 [Fusarium ambrosium]
MVWYYLVKLRHDGGPCICGMGLTVLPRAQLLCKAIYLTGGGDILGQVKSQLNARRYDLGDQMGDIEGHGIGPGGEHG